MTEHDDKDVPFTVWPLPDRCEVCWTKVPGLIEDLQRVREVGG